MIARVLLLLGISVLLVGASVGTASAQTSIRDGLWAGSNFTVSNMTAPKAPTTPPARNPNAYAALGDSVAAGAGLPLAANATATDARCGRSPAAYPHQVAAAKNMTLVHAACGGAKVGDLFTPQRVQGPNFGPQLRKAFAQGVPGLMSITAGANDVYWDTYVQKCYARTCGTRLDTKASDKLIALMETKYDIALLTIKAKSSGNPPTVLLTGYYNPLSAACSAVEPRLTPAEIAWMTNRLQAINEAIRRVSTRYAFTRYVPINFTGHDLCSAQPWIQGPTDAAPLHPTTTGQHAIARALLDTIQ